jgi:hypothetical protein
MIKNISFIVLLLMFSLSYATDKVDTNSINSSHNRYFQFGLKDYALKNKTSGGLVHKVTPRVLMIGAKYWFNKYLGFEANYGQSRYTSPNISGTYDVKIDRLTEAFVLLRNQYEHLDVYLKIGETNTKMKDVTGGKTLARKVYGIGATFNCPLVKGNRINVGHSWTEDKKYNASDSDVKMIDITYGIPF